MTISDAVALLDDDLRRPIGGGTSIRHDGGGPPVEVVDLQALGLGAIVTEGERVRLGATATLQQVTDGNAVPDLVRRVAQAEQPSTMRTITTVGGTIGAADPESVLLAAFVVHDALVHFADGRGVELSTVLDGGMLRGDLIVSVSLATTGRGSLASTARTPADSPIVAAVGRVVDGGTVVALTGVGPVPRIYERRDLEHLEPPNDFRGTSNYRRHLASVLSARVAAELS